MIPLQKYNQRSPRYILLPQDDCFIRVAGPKQVPWEEGTEIMNVSTSGLAFTAPDDLAPRVGEHIKLQFLVPGSGQMACFGQVTRIEPWSHGRILVGLKYQYLDLPQQYYLKKGLAGRLKNVKEDKNEFAGSAATTISGTLVAKLFLSAFLLFSIFAIFTHWNPIDLAQYLLNRIEIF